MEKQRSIGGGKNSLVRGKPGDRINRHHRIGCIPDSQSSSFTQEAAMFIRQTPPTEISGIISIHGSREFAVECNCIHRLDLVFDDTESPTTNDVASLQRELRQRRWNEQNNRIENAPSLSDAAAIIEFAKKVQNASGTIVCHCGAGMSRAPAAALICMAVWNGPGTESGCVDSIRQLRHGGRAAHRIGWFRRQTTEPEREIDRRTQVRQCSFSSQKKSRIHLEPVC